MSRPSTAPILRPAGPAPFADRNRPAARCRGDHVVHSCTSAGILLRIALRGEIDHYSVAPVRALLVSAAATGARLLILDTARVTFADSALLKALALWRRDGRRLRLTGTSRAVAHLLVAARLRGGCPAPGP
ncbi:STAS domain-containing protein [Streptomyces sp. C10-9-1]|uniref:STAS domain-containing protein n=1 Tax=Streptomyces sp. C10-9-1 TaxID=1859285 RepID=UPI003F4A2E27